MPGAASAMGVWTGTEMIVGGGAESSYDDQNVMGGGGRYCVDI
jgi:hypothetical protein